MSPTALRVLGLSATLAYAAFVAWVYLAQPQNLAEMRGGVASVVGLYEIDSVQFAQGRRLLHEQRYAEARAAFDRADPAVRHAETQFYVAYTYYRQGWGRLYNDDALFRAALAALDRATALSPGGRVQVSDPQLGLTDSDALRAELEHGLTLEAEDFNPLRVFRKPR
jgi:tetratricopeptide (TPR) repeat protein